MASLWRYPVKGLGGESLTGAAVSERGFRFDRLLGLAHDRVPIEPFGSWTTYEAFHALDGRPDLGGFAARMIAGVAGQLGHGVEIASPAGDHLTLRLTEAGDLAEAPGSAETVSNWFSTPAGTARMVSSGDHLWDFADAPISVINLATIRDLGRASGLSLDPRRFRANVYVDGLDPWSEFDLVGGRARIGDAVIEFLRPIERCRATAVDPDDGSTAINVPGVLASHFGHIYCGVYARVVQPGRISVGMHLTLGKGSTPDLHRQGLGNEDIAGSPRWASVVTTYAASTRARAVELSDPYGALQRANPGQHVRLHRVEHGTPGWRNYTLSKIGSPTRISVEQHPDGRMSPWVTALTAGDRVLITGPFGDAVVKGDSHDDLVLLVAGIGVTPALAIVHALADLRSTRRVEVVYVVRELGDLVHWKELQTAMASLRNARLHVFVTGERASPTPYRQGRPTSADIGALVSDPHATSVHICGPAGFLRDMRTAVHSAGVPVSNVHFDAFYSPRPVDLTPRPAPVPGPFDVTFSRTGLHATWTSDDGTLLDVAEASGLRPAASCRAGACGTCAAHVDGTTSYLLDPVAEPADGSVLLCCAVPTSDALIDL